MSSHSLPQDAFFAAGDANCDGLLTYEEFVAALPSSVRSKRKPIEFRQWFGMLDKDHSGSVTMSEFFEWSLSTASIALGSGAKRVFRRFDEDKSGALDLNEFSRAAASFGFAECASAFFAELDTQSDGVINYVELLDATLQGGAQQQTTFSPALRQFLTAMSWDTDKDSEPVDTSDWSFTATSAADVKRELSALLIFHACRLSQIFAQVDTNQDFVVSYGEFLAMFEQSLGFEGTRATLNEVWLELDADDSGVVSFDELDGWTFGNTFGQEKRKQAVRELSLLSRIHPSDVPWTVGKLREEMRALIEDADVRASDLLQAWDVNGDGRLRKREWLVHFKR